MLKNGFVLKAVLYSIETANIKLSDVNLILSGFSSNTVYVSAVILVLPKKSMMFD